AVGGAEDLDRAGHLGAHEPGDQGGGDLGGQFAQVDDVDGDLFAAVAGEGADAVGYPVGQHAGGGRVAGPAADDGESELLVAHCTVSWGPGRAGSRPASLRVSASRRRISSSLRAAVTSR